MKYGVHIWSCCILNVFSVHITSIIRKGSFPQNAPSIVHPLNLCAVLYFIIMLSLFVRAWPPPSLIYKLPEKDHKEKNQRSNENTDKAAEQQLEHKRSRV
ncbi:hypothetical protein V1520DRAFT_271905 [Lipomyces starkeyi]|uniref:Uncharacterized protein n=1 Tax=Lipomyces starkeyi NRRL Y-11557 TaxID=675824 RepID=A0A1E3QDA1_LIPST|nr:hypothetical protein LIPSTDRAFT_212993 [Lipomyces starkeyi NRRL Y-11557]